MNWFTGTFMVELAKSGATHSSQVEGAVVLAFLFAMVVVLSALFSDSSVPFHYFQTQLYAMLLVMGPVIYLSGAFSLVVLFAITAVMNVMLVYLDTGFKQANT